MVGEALRPKVGRLDWLTNLPSVKFVATQNGLEPSTLASETDGVRLNLLRPMGGSENCGVQSMPVVKFEARMRLSVVAPVVTSTSLKVDGTSLRTEFTRKELPS